MNRLFDRCVAALTDLYPESEAKAIVKWLFAEYLNCHPGELFRYMRDEPNETFRYKVAQATARLEKGEPIQYVLGFANFLEDRYNVGPGVLIPRPETEGLVKLVLAQEKHTPPQTLIDFGTGSGVIAISLALRMQKTAVFAVEQSETALNIAKTNAQRLKAKVTFIHGDFYETQSLAGNLPPADVFVSNPPYIPQNEAQTLHINVKTYEPPEALFVPDCNPFAPFQAILAYAKAGGLKQNGRIYFEIHTPLANELVEHLSGQFPNINIEVKKDFADRERYLCILFKN